MTKTKDQRMFRIVRYRHGHEPVVIRDNVSYAEGKYHVSLATSHGPGWFDGFEYMPENEPSKEVSHD